MNPASTGGAGTFFEQHVDAALLAMLLVRAIPPVLKDCSTSQVHFQTDRMGWHTDDIIIEGACGNGVVRKLLIQSKRTITISASDSECEKTFIDAWKDFQKAEFNRTLDRIAIVTLRGTNTFLGNFVGLLDCARASQNLADFGSRLSTPGLVNQGVVRYSKEVRSILDNHTGGKVADEEYWNFLKVFYGISYDLNTGTSQTESAIKSLLALSSSEDDPIAAAEASWNELLREVSGGMPDGKSYQWEDLPESVRTRHTPIVSTSQRVLASLSDHGSVILDGIRTTVGSECHLQRPGIIHEIIESLQGCQVVLVTGPAGSGKSGVAKLAVDLLQPDHFVFSFRAEEFAVPHLDEVLHRVQAQVNGRTLGSLLAGHGQKLLLVESVERLLEASSREAFVDLLVLVRRDPSWRLLVTCRDYSTDLVRSALLEHAGIEHSLVEVPWLDEAELSVVKGAIPKLATPLGNKPLRELLKSPYMLDLAARMDWPEGQSLPETEAAFRDLFWRRVVRKEENAATGMPRRRGLAFVQIALRRAKSLSLFADCSDIDSDVLDSLHHDSLTITCDASDTQVAPAHDVLEDWAILRWIEELYARHENSLIDMANELGTEPAIRRSYRKWVGELVEQSTNAADSVYDAIVSQQGLPAHFHDDTLVSLLRSSASVGFLERHSSSLLADGRRLLRRVIHLLRVGCVTTPAWFGGVGEVASLMHVPDGDAWEAVLRLVASQLDEFEDDDVQLLLGLAEDAARGVSWRTPYPKGSDDIVKIAYSLLPRFDDYRSEDSRKRALQLIAKLPKCEADKTTEMLTADEQEDRDRLGEDFRELVLSDMDGFAVCRDLPEAVLTILRRELLLTEDILKKRRREFYDTHTEPHFGLRERMGFRHFPPSAFHGPFLFLLRHHPALGINFSLEVFNHSAEWYASNRVPMDYVAPPYEITLRFPDGEEATQWCNDRLWGWYRGATVGPHVLQSILMALELWLFEAGEASPDRIDGILLGLLRRSKSAAITAVVASVATAYPRITPETLLALLSSRECILLDKQRLVQEHSVSAMQNMLPTFDSMKKIYENERKESSEREHRGHDLEIAIANLQLTPHAERVQELLDKLRSEMPSVDQQNERDRVWRLALHRMDLRQYYVSDQPAGSPPEATNTREGDTEESRLIRLDIKELEADVQQMVVATAKKLSSTDARVALFMWGYKTFSGEESSQHDPNAWHERLDEARRLPEAIDEEGYHIARGAPAFVASVCVRDHFEELTMEERDWCVDAVCTTVEQDSNNWDRLARIQRGSMEGDRPSAFVIPSLVGKALDARQAERVNMTLVLAVTHPTEEVRMHAVAGAGKYLWSTDPQLARRCVNALATEASLVQGMRSAEREKPYSERKDYGAIEYEAVQQVRAIFFETTEDLYPKLDISDWTGSAANHRIIRLLCFAPEEEMAASAFERLAGVLVQWWDEDDDRRNERDRSDESVIGLTTLFEEFILQVPPKQSAVIIEPIVAAVERHPREAASVLRGVIGSEDRLQQTDRFWAIWTMFAEQVRKAKWLSSLDAEHPRGSEIMATIFLTEYWKKEVTHWASLEGHAQNVHQLFQDLPPTALVLDNYVRFLYHIGEQSLPRAFTLVAERLKQGNSAAMLRIGNTVYMLETLLRRYVYGSPLAMKSDRALRDAVLYLLDTLVESGSSSAYRMRDDFVTPIGP